MDNYGLTQFDFGKLVASDIGFESEGIHIGNLVQRLAESLHFSLKGGIDQNGTCNRVDDLTLVDLYLDSIGTLL